MRGIVNLDGGWQKHGVEEYQVARWNCFQGNSLWRGWWFHGTCCFIMKKERQKGGRDEGNMNKQTNKQCYVCANDKNTSYCRDHDYSVYSKVIKIYIHMSKYVKNFCE